MSQAMQQLNETRAALAVALREQDWQAIAELDQACRAQVEQAMGDAGRDEQALRETMEQLLAMYGELLAACRQQRETIGEELATVRRASQGAKVYQLFG
ncbi:hypothetical protein D3C76_604830 [compost metagenome]